MTILYSKKEGRERERAREEGERKSGGRRKQTEGEIRGHIIMGTELQRKRGRETESQRVRETDTERG